MVEIGSGQNSAEAQPAVGFITAPSVEVARRLASRLLELQSVACVNLIPAVESIYRWEGNVESAQETLMMVKTLRSAQQLVIETIANEHPYDVPECIFVEVTEGHPPYLSWIQQEVCKA